MEATIVIPSAHEYLFRLIVEEGHGGKLIGTRGPEIGNDDFGGQSSFLICDIEYGSHQILFDIGVDFALGCVLKEKKKNQSINN